MSEADVTYDEVHPPKDFEYYAELAEYWADEAERWRPLVHEKPHPRFDGAIQMADIYARLAAAAPK